ncbi:hypothetical protein [Acinetobacter rudis]|uniref:Uncharacterized protein n=1 Tax=Acinetobacter rudis CIP 110305 TaxID=421052 RepID=S3NHZ4_9GAMM|nr:hypothetical protein [Acinetobacter rudis]EPF73974.1 hypothetical protein F945_01853 [Acinetobacter rudis CIP 110305]
MENFNIERDIQSISFLIPARTYNADFDITKKTPIPALLESCIKIINEVDVISPRKIQIFFGLNDSEREILIDQIINTGWVKFDDEGKLTSTLRLKEWINDSQSLEMVETLSFTEKVVIDLLTNHVQPRSEFIPIKGLPRITNNFSDNEIDVTNIFSNQFTRFKDCINNQHIKNPRSSLYRVRNISSLRVSELIIGINLRIKFDEFKNFYIEPKLISHSEVGSKLISSSGLLSQVVNFIDNIQRSTGPKLSFQHYCDIFDDKVIFKYYNFEENYFDLVEYLKDRANHKTGYGNPETQGLIGPIYLDIDSKLKSYFRSIKDVGELPIGIWKPSCVDLYGASVNLREFIENVNENLRGHNSELVTLFPEVDKTQNYQIKEKFYNRLGNGYFINSIRELDESEVFVIPGENGFAYCQYHVNLDPNLGFQGLTMPIGFFTRDKDRIDLIWNHIRKFYMTPGGLKLRSFSRAYNSTLDENRIYHQLVTSI